MTGTQDFYRLLGVPENAEPEEVREHAREHMDEYRERIDDAADPESEERRLILAYEVLTDPEERYLYELLGHEKYLDERLEGQELSSVEGVNTGAGITPIFEGGGGGDKEIFDPTTQSSDTEIFDASVDEVAVAGEQTLVDSGGATRVQGGSGTESPDEPGMEGTDTGGASVDDSETRVEDETQAETNTETTEDEDGSEDGSDEAEDTQSLDQVSAEETFVEQLSEFPIWDSPLAALPGMDHEDYREVAAVGYGLVGLAAIVGAGAMVPFGSLVFGLVAASAFLVGSLGTYSLGSLRYQRELTERTGYASLLVVPALAAPELALTTGTPGSVLAVGGVVSGLAGVAVGNAYIEGTRQRIRDARHEENSRGGENYTETDPTAGTNDSSIDGDAILETLVEENSSGANSIADDLLNQATIHATRHVVPERHIERKLLVEDERTNREVPVSDFSHVRSQLREDVDDRDQNHPNGFSEQTDKYLMPSTVTEVTCPKCEGAATVTCATCGGRGQVSCRNCGGDTRVKCGRCGGNGRVSSGDGYKDCGSCGAKGYKPCGRCSATGNETCGTCGGDGIVQCDRCEGDTKVVQFMTLTRTYTPTTDVGYVNKSIPVEHLESPEGNQIRKERMQNPNVEAIGGDVFMVEEEEREIPTDVITYEYAGDLWESYEMDDGVKAPTYPRELGTRVRALTGVSVILFAAFVAVGVLGPEVLP